MKSMSDSSPSGKLRDEGLVTIYFTPFPLSCLPLHFGVVRHFLFSPTVSAKDNDFDRSPSYFAIFLFPMLFKVRPPLKPPSPLSAVLRDLLLISQCYINFERL